MIKGLLFVTVLTVAAAIVPTAPLYASKKITYCHVPAGNPANAHTITTSVNAAKNAGHFVLDANGVVRVSGGHGGDYVGSCDEAEDETPATHENQEKPVKHGFKHTPRKSVKVSVAVSKKVTYCHVPPGNHENAHTITTSVNAAIRPGHLVLDANGDVQATGGHGGDYLGECEPKKDTTPVTPGKGSTPPVKDSTPVTPVNAVVETPQATDTLPDTSGDPTLAFTLIAAGLATIVTGLIVGIKSLYRHIV